MLPTTAVPAYPPRRVLLVIEDGALSELLAEVLAEAGHTALLADGESALATALGGASYDVAIVDLDTRARDGLQLLEYVRRSAPATTLVALLPCGGLPASSAAPAYHLAIEKPAKLVAVLRAVNAAPASQIR
ncbi:MAG: hypothetical protein JWN44_675 [Myxococcales bacterium]|nr:hypothetical protein [Myxococcales bacterium]